MLRISRLTDYGTLVLAHLSAGENVMTSAADVASTTGIAAPTVSKILKNLAKAGLVTSSRGAQGGYRLARDACEISAADIIDALEGPVHITECSAHGSQCDLEAHCNVGGAWQRINVAIRRALGDINLRDLQRAKAPVPQFEFGGLPVTVERKN
ncbi:MAG: SUF system Fe-S cluster assembly regulator [Gammaproteobacteria bacterium]|nr:SUF system Fe-S cluster assembly regulator [Gammaproteobacteria bacterium]